MKDVSGVAVVTGAAGGMGAATAKLFAAQGRPLLLCDLHADRLQAAAAPLRDAGNTVEVLAGDLADPGFPAALLARLGGRKIAALVHTAGLSPSMADGPRILEVNYTATERLVTAVQPHMAEASAAVLISSCSGHMARSAEADAAIAQLMAGDAAAVRAMAAEPGAAYAISKRALYALVRREATAFGAARARIVSISPGLIDTGMGRQEFAVNEFMNVMLEKTPLQRLGQAEEIASVAAFLCSPAAAYVTGCDIQVDGGTLAGLGF